MFKGNSGQKGESKWPGEVISGIIIQEKKKVIKLHYLEEKRRMMG